MECELLVHENENGKMRGKLFESGGISHGGMNLLLDAKQDGEFKNWRNLTLSELESFVAGTNRFSTEKFQIRDAHHQNTSTSVSIY